MFSSEVDQFLEEIIDQIVFNDKKRLLVALPESAGDIFLVTSILPNLRETYPDFDIYFACKPQFFDILKGNNNIDYLIPYNDSMNQIVLMEGYGSWPGLFDITFCPALFTQLWFHYAHNTLDKVNLNLR